MFAEQRSNRVDDGGIPLFGSESLVFDPVVVESNPGRRGSCPTPVAAFLKYLTSPGPLRHLSATHVSVALQCRRVACTVATAAA